MLQIEKDEIIRKKYTQGFERKNKLGVKIAPTTFVLHGTQGGGTLNWWRNADESKREDRDRIANYKKGIGLTQFFIDTKGVITEVIDPQYWLYHSSTGFFDKETIGVELENKTKDNSGIYTKKQYEAVFNLYTHLRYKEGFSKMVDIVGHDTLKISKGQSPKGCPGTGFDWGNFENMFTQIGFIFKKGKYKYNCLTNIQDGTKVG